MTPIAPVIVVGGSLGGLAAAARLAKAGHRVVLLERASRLGGRWLPSAGQAEALPPILGLPAPWRDLLRKSGRAFDDELERAGLTLTPAPPATHLFPEGEPLMLPADRGEQYHALAAWGGEPIAVAWRDLLDRLDESWLAWRHLGLEAEFAGRSQLDRRARKDLLWGQSVADIARDLPDERLANIVSSVAWRLGSDPRDTPAWAAARLAVERRFGRWQLTRGGRTAPASALVEVLIARLQARGVEVRTETAALRLTRNRVLTDQGDLPAAAVLSCVNPWEHARLLGRPAPRVAWSPLRPALAPRVTVAPQDSAGQSPEAVRETLTHSPNGPRVTYRLAGSLLTHDHSEPTPDPSYGVAWRGGRTWLALPPTTDKAAGVYYAGVGSRGGPDPWAQLLSGALATYAAHQRLTGQDIRPTNRAPTKDA